MTCQKEPFFFFIHHPLAVSQPTYMQTRAKNANTHPGDLVNNVKTKRRTKAEMERDRTIEAEKKKRRNNLKPKAETESPRSRPKSQIRMQRHPSCQKKDH